MHPVLAANPTWAEYERKRQRLAEQRQAQVAHDFAARRPYEEAVVAHRAAVAEAVEKGEAPPVAPAPPDLRHLGDAAAPLHSQVEAHRERRDEVLAAAATDLLNALEDRERAGNARLGQMVPDLRELHAERVADLALVAQVIGAVDRQAGETRHPSRAERVPRDLTVEALLAAAESGTSVLAPAGTTDLPCRRVLLDDGQDDGVRQVRPRSLGMVSGGTFGGVHPTDWPTTQRLPPGRV